MVCVGEEGGVCVMCVWCVWCVRCVRCVCEVYGVR